MIHSLKSGEYLRSIYPKNNIPITNVRICPKFGYIVMFLEKDQSLFLYSINGDLLHKNFVTNKIQSMIISDDEEYLITGASDSVLQLFHLHSLTSIDNLVLDCGISSLAFSSFGQFLFVGLQNGDLLVGVFLTN
ncbi:beach domain-containing protein lvsc [Anaeramoeba ignava]|uniref:Beach domain-containing protein lvsc n=1 Tax=Anaeramoeba ignava TaxID=1746090 RepID=A0A9Q0RF41_ANAIG|nr:beach domain-containing protein lvsc [Anaeramoeba ignava]